MGYHSAENRIEYLVPLPKQSKGSTGQKLHRRTLHQTTNTPPIPLLCCKGKVPYKFCEGCTCLKLKAIGQNVPRLIHGSVLGRVLVVLVLSPCVLVLVVRHSRAACPPFVGSVFWAVTWAHWAVARGCHGSPFCLRVGLPSPMAMWRWYCPPLVEPLLRAAPHLPSWCPEGRPPNRGGCPPLAHLSHG